MNFAQLDRIEWKLDMLLALARGGGQVAAVTEQMVARQETVERKEMREADRVVLETMNLLSMKQHATIQMVVRGASNAEIADRFGVSVNTSKVYLRSLAKRFGVTLRTQIAVAVQPVLRELTDAQYQQMAKGLPRNWDATYAYARREEDPFWSRYTGSRVKVSEVVGLDDDADAAMMDGE